MAEIYKVAESWMGVWVRKGPGVSYAKLSVIYGKDKKEYTVTERKNKYWLKIGDNKWVCDRDSNGMIVMKKTGTTSAAKVKASDVNASNNSKLTEVDEESYAYVPDTELIVLDKYQSSEIEYLTDIKNNFTISNIRGIFGMPYQFMVSTDPRLSNKTDALGRKYAKEIVASMPLLLITPGTPRFMGKYGKKDKESVLEQFIGYAAGHEENIKDLILGEDFGKYYTLEYAYNEYYKYVNPMCRFAARYMNLQDVKIDGVKLDSFRWAENTNDNFNKLFTVYRGCTAWYCDSDTQISDTFTNSTTPSMIGDKINSLSDYGRELQFLLGTAKSETGLALDKFTSAENLTTNMSNVNNFIDGVLGNSSSVGGIFKTLTNSVQTVVAGGKLVFPELWGGSEFSRSYDIKLKLVSPDGDDLSVYLNIIVPILHLLGLVLPREAVKSHGYISPFLVRAYYKGLFNVDMGIITDMSITKGKESAWTPSGVPTTVDVSFTIKDLYNDMYMTNMDGMKYKMMNNIILLDYIGNLCGININETDVIRGIDMYFTQNIKNRITDTWHLKIWGALDQWVTNRWASIFSKF